MAHLVTLKASYYYCIRQVLPIGKTKINYLLLIYLNPEYWCRFKTLFYTCHILLADQNIR